MVKDNANHNVAITFGPPTLEKYQFFKSMYLGLRNCPIAKALFTVPEISDSMIKDFWQNVVHDENGNNKKGVLRSTVQGHAVEVTVDVIREVMAFGDQDSYPAELELNVVIDALDRMGCEGVRQKFPPSNKGLLPCYWRLLAHVYICCISHRNTKTDDISQLIGSGIVALANGWNFNFSQMVFNAMVANVPKDTVLYPRFLQMIFDERYPHIPKPADRMDQKHLADSTYKGLAAKGKNSGTRPVEKFGRFPETEGVNVQNIAPEEEEPVIEPMIPEPVDENDPDIQMAPQPPVVPPVVVDLDSEEDVEAVAEESQGSGQEVDLDNLDEVLTTFVPSMDINRSVLGKKIGLDLTVTSTTEEEEAHRPQQEADLVSRKRKRNEAGAETVEGESAQKETRTTDGSDDNFDDVIAEKLGSIGRGDDIGTGLDLDALLKDFDAQMQGEAGKEQGDKPGNEGAATTGDDSTRETAQERVIVSNPPPKFRSTSAYGASSSGATKDKLKEEDIDLFVLLERIDVLEEEGAKKDSLIAELVADNADKDKRITELQADLGGVSAQVMRITQALEGKFGDKFLDTPAAQSSADVHQAGMEAYEKRVRWAARQPPQPPSELAKKRAEKHAKRVAEIKARVEADEKARMDALQRVSVMNDPELELYMIIMKNTDKSVRGVQRYMMMNRNRELTLYGDRSGVYVWGFDEERELFFIKRKSGNVEYYPDKQAFQSLTASDLNEMLHASFYNPNNQAMVDSFREYLLEQSKYKFKYFPHAQLLNRITRNKTRLIRWPRPNYLDRIPVVRSVPNYTLRDFEMWIYDYVTDTVVIKTHTRVFRIIDKRDLMMFGEWDLKRLNDEQLYIAENFEAARDQAVPFIGMIKMLLKERLWAGGRDDEDMVLVMVRKPKD